jgi:hypothetical protein
MQSAYAVTFEFEVARPATHRGVVVGSSASALMRKAVREAQAACRPRNWTSVVCVLLERDSKAGPGDARAQLEKGRG